MVVVACRISFMAVTLSLLFAALSLGLAALFVPGAEQTGRVRGSKFDLVDFPN